jgi:hypothetical protein|tara:strand:+ start:5922 stop:6293 length:372 start_codon:yes stop_codon:yes gene_type:complete
MNITPAKKEFIKRICGGIHVLMTCTYLANDISQDPREPEEYFIRDKILDYGEFSEHKFCEAIETLSNGDITSILTYLDDRDIYLQRVFMESQIPIQELTDTDLEFALLVEDRDLVTFEDFLSY